MTQDERLDNLRELRDLTMSVLTLERLNQKAAPAVYRQMTDLAFALSIGEAAS